MGLLVIRFGLGVFLLLSSCDKSASQKRPSEFSRVFCKISISTSAAYAVGGVEANSRQ